MHKILILQLTILITPVSALAGKSSSITPYISGFGQLALMEDSDIGSSDPTFDAFIRSRNTHNEMEVGFGGGIAAGLLIKRKFRLELEFSTRSIDIKQTSFDSTGAILSFPVDGDISTHALTINGEWDFRNSSRITPYIGASLGMAWHDHDIPASNFLGVAIPAFQDEDSAFAYQVKVGLGYWFLRQGIGFIGYRYFGTEDAEFSFNGSTILDTYTIDQHILEIGFRYFFGKP